MSGMMHKLNSYRAKDTAWRFLPEYLKYLDYEHIATVKPGGLVVIPVASII